MAVNEYLTIFVNQVTDTSVTCLYCQGAKLVPYVPCGQTAFPKHLAENVGLDTTKERFHCISGFAVTPIHDLLVILA